MNTSVVRQLGIEHNLVFGILKEHCLFLTRAQIQRILARPTSTTKRELASLVSGKYLARRYRVDTFMHFQTPLYYLGELGWMRAGNAAETYRRYKQRVGQRSEWHCDHLLAVYDVLLKFMLESNVKTIIGGEDAFWQENFGFGNIPDAWVQLDGSEAAFIEVDQGTEARQVIATKFENYLKFKRSGNFGIMFPGCKFKVLFLTTTEERIESLEPLLTSDDIWFAVKEEFLREKLDHQHWFALKRFYALSVAAKEKM